MRSAHPASKGRCLGLDGRHQSASTGDHVDQRRLVDGFAATLSLISRLVSLTPIMPAAP
jgi:hypothetical protein